MAQIFINLSDPRYIRRLFVLWTVFASTLSAGVPSSDSWLNPSQNPTLNLTESIESFNKSTNSTGDSNSENRNLTSPSESGVKVEDILRDIFAAEFENDEAGQEQNEEAVKEVTVKSEIQITSDAVIDSKKNGSIADTSNNSEPQRHGRNHKYLSRRQRPDAREESKRPGFSGKRKNNRNRVGGANKGQKEGGGAISTKSKGKGVELEKYNAYMDAVLKRMNSLIRNKRMDPLRVNLYAGAGPSKNNLGNKGLQRKNNKRKHKGPQRNKNRKQNGGRLDLEDAEDSQSDEDQSSSRGDDDDNGQEQSQERKFSKSGLNGLQRKVRAVHVNETELDSFGMYGLPETKKPNEGDRPGEGRGKGQTGGNKKGNKVTATNDTEEEGVVQVVKPKKKMPPRPTRGILHGLSSLRRDGNVQVIKDGERARIIRSRFLLGPVALEILPKKTKRKGPGLSSREDMDNGDIMPTSTPPPAATATAPQLKGILEIRLSPGKPTRIRKLRVFPPGNIQVEGDNKKSEGNIGMKKSVGYRKVTPMATARLKQAAVQVVRQVDNTMKVNRRRQQEQ